MRKNQIKNFCINCVVMMELIITQTFSSTELKSKRKKEKSNTSSKGLQLKKSLNKAMGLKRSKNSQESLKWATWLARPIIRYYPKISLETFLETCQETNPWWAEIDPETDPETSPEIGQGTSPETKSENKAPTCQWDLRAQKSDWVQTQFCLPNLRAWVGRKSQATCQYQ